MSQQFLLHNVLGAPCHGEETKHKAATAGSQAQAMAISADITTP
jgi:hypothetical protein